MGPRERSLKIKYAVGMIMKCNHSSFADHMGVIIWWDEKYNRNVRIEHGNIILYSLSLPPHSSASLNQPFYAILTENGNLYYAAQGTNKLLDAFTYFIYFYRFIYMYASVRVYNIKKSFYFRYFSRGKSAKVD